MQNKEAKTDGAAGAGTAVGLRPPSVPAPAAPSVFASLFCMTTCWLSYAHVRLNFRDSDVSPSLARRVSLTDPDARSMATSGRGSGVVGYNVQVAVDTAHHLIITHEVTNVGTDRSQLAHVSKETKATTSR